MARRAAVFTGPDKCRAVLTVPRETRNGPLGSIVICDLATTPASVPPMSWRCSFAAADGAAGAFSSAVCAPLRDRTSKRAFTSLIPGSAAPNWTPTLENGPCNAIGSPVASMTTESTTSRTSGNRHGGPLGAAAPPELGEDKAAGIPACSAPARPDVAHPPTKTAAAKTWSAVTTARLMGGLQTRSPFPYLRMTTR